MRQMIVRRYYMQMRDGSVGGRCAVRTGRVQRLLDRWLGYCTEATGRNLSLSSIDSMGNGEGELGGVGDFCWEDL